MKNVLKLSCFALITLLFSSCGYNSMVGLEEEVSGQWANVEGAYQRRADLIPNLVNTVKGYADFEKETITGVTNARARAGSITIDPSNITPAALKKFQEAQSGLSSSLSRLLMTVERYPDLKANQNFLELQSQLEGTENRISVERKKFNDAVKGYNSYVRKFPNNFTAGIFGFDKKGYFEADASAAEAPKVDFGN